MKSDQRDIEILLGALEAFLGKRPEKVTPLEPFFLLQKKTIGDIKVCYWEKVTGIWEEEIE